MKEYNLVDKDGSIKGYEGKWNIKDLKTFLDKKSEEAKRHLNDDLHDMTTLQLVDKLIKNNKNELSDEVVTDVSTQVERFKSISILNQYHRNAKGLGYGELTQKEANEIKRIRDM